MQNRSLLSVTNQETDRSSLSTRNLTNFLAEWIDDGEWRGHSEATRQIHRNVADRFKWFLNDREFDSCGSAEIRQFLNYVKNGHTDPRGRWGNPQQTRPVRKSTVHQYFTRLRTFFRWLVKQKYLLESPMDTFDVPDNKRDQIQPFTDNQINDLLKAAGKSQNALRDETIIWLLYDTGIRASELCGLTRHDVDLTEKRITVVGKGNKRRLVYFGKYAAKALWSYLRNFEIDGPDPLFQSECGIKKGEKLNKDSLGLMFNRLEKNSGIHGVRCSPHTLRHTFAIQFLRAGGSAFALKEILGHEDLTMTNRYVRLADADLANQRRFSPADRLKQCGNR
jgi:integrase/recombinase XerC